MKDTNGYNDIFNDDDIENDEKRNSFNELIADKQEIPEEIPSDESFYDYLNDSDDDYSSGISDYNAYGDRELRSHSSSDIFNDDDIQSANSGYKEIFSYDKFKKSNRSADRISYNDSFDATGSFDVPASTPTSGTARITAPEKKRPNDIYGDGFSTTADEEKRKEQLRRNAQKNYPQQRTSSNTGNRTPRKSSSAKKRGANVTKIAMTVAAVVVAAAIIVSAVSLFVKSNSKNTKAKTAATVSTIAPATALPSSAALTIAETTVPTATERVTEAPTTPPTDPPTEAPTEPPTEPYMETTTEWIEPETQEEPDNSQAEDTDENYN